MALANLEEDRFQWRVPISSTRLWSSSEGNWVGSRIKLEDRNVNKEAHIAETLHAEFDTRLKELNKADHALYRYAKSKMNSSEETSFWKRF